MTEIDRAICRARNSYQEARKDLIKKLRELAGDLNNEACRLGADEETFPMVAGVVQGLGRDIDRLCAVVRERFDHLEVLIDLKGN
jgi:hypothetical protein